MPIPTVVPPDKKAIFNKLLTELKTTRKDRLHLEGQLNNDLSPFDFLKLQGEINVLSMKEDVLQNKLIATGYVDPRGRPAKPNNEKYSATRSKFTAMLNKDNLNYLKHLKSIGDINNISAFLDYLIEGYRNTNTPKKKSP